MAQARKIPTTKNPQPIGLRVNARLKKQKRLLLPSALLVSIGLQALFALVLIHLQTAFLFEVTHVVSGLD